MKIYNHRMGKQDISENVVSKSTMNKITLLIAVIFFSLALSSCQELLQAAIEQSVDSITDDGKPKVVSVWQDDKAKADISFYDNKEVAYGSGVYTYTGDPTQSSGTIEILVNGSLLEKWTITGDNAVGTEPNRTYTRIK